MSYQTNLRVLHASLADTPITSGDVDLLDHLYNPIQVIHMLNDVINDDALLTKIANRSYIHALGFYKIVLMDLSKDVPGDNQKTQVRLHLWNPSDNNGLPIVESLHEHSFDFVSRVLTGELENQQFLLSPLSEAEQAVLEKIKAVFPTLTPEEQASINGQVEKMEAIRLSYIGSRQYQDMKADNEFDSDTFMALTGLTSREIKLLTNIEGHYVSDRVAGERKAYKHVLKDYVSLTPFAVMSLKAGSIYFHPYQLPHRLYYDNKILNSTILITTPVPSNPEGGSLQRPTYVQKEEQAYDKVALTSESLKKVLVDYIKHLEKA